MAKAIADYRNSLRTVLQDIPQAGTYAYPDPQIDSLIIATVELGLGPRGVEVKGNFLDPEPATPDARGFMIFQAALMALGGRTGFNWKTRAMSVTMSPQERRMTIDNIRRTIHRLETSGDPHGTGGSALFGIWEDCENAIQRCTIPVRKA